jgi:hypothetical protein
MNKDEIKDLAASVHQRLLNKAREANRPFNELLQYYAIERFLYRLSCSPFADRFVLKGALMFNAWGVAGIRPTRDIDLLGNTSNAVAQIVEKFREICGAEVSADGLVFDVESVQGERIKEDADYEGVRVTFTGWLGKTRVHMQIDIGFADIVTPAPIDVNYPTILDFPAPILHGYPRETLIAEKFQAMVALGEINSRLKDFYDICTLAMQFDFAGEALQKAIEQTFKQRGTSLPADIPVALTEKFVSQKELYWDAFIQRTGLQQPDYDFRNAVWILQKFLMPPTHASVAGHRFKAIWKKGGEWVEQ